MILHLVVIFGVILISGFLFGAGVSLLVPKKTIRKRAEKKLRRKR